MLGEGALVPAVRAALDTASRARVVPVPGGYQTVTAFGVLADVHNGYPVFLSEMTLLTALRTAATSAMVARTLARPGSRVMAMIGTSARPPFRRRIAAVASNPSISGIWTSIRMRS